MVQQGRERHWEDLEKSHAKLVEQCLRWITLEKTYCQEVLDHEKSGKSIEAVLKRVRKKERAANGLFEWLSESRVMQEADTVPRSRRRRRVSLF